MREFATSGVARLTGPAELLIRLVMCALPVTTFKDGYFAMSAGTALFLGVIDGWARLWGSCTSRSFVADPEGLTIASRFSVRLVPWAKVSAIQTWRHFNRIDCVAIHHLRAGRIEVATCLDRYSEEGLLAFVRACAGRVSSDSPRLSIRLAGLCDRAVYLPLLLRFAQDVTMATLVGYAMDVGGQASLLGLLAASQSALLTAIRYPIRATTLVQRDGLWCPRGREASPLRIVPRALRLWVRYLADAEYRVASQGSGAQGEGGSASS